MRPARAMTVITDPLTGGTAVAIVAGAGPGIAVMAGSEVNTKEVIGNDDAKLAPTRGSELRRWRQTSGGAGHE